MPFALDPHEMTNAERAEETARLFSIAIVRLISCPPTSSIDSPESSQTPLEVSAHTRLTVPTG